MTDILMTSRMYSHRVLIIDNLLFGIANFFSCDIKQFIYIPIYIDKFRFDRAVHYVTTLVSKTKRMTFCSHDSFLRLKSPENM